MEPPLPEETGLVATLPRRGWRPSRRLVWIGAALLLAGAAVGGLAVYEAQTSRLQARFLSRYAAGLAHQTAPGASAQMRFPTHGPFDQRLGYTAIPDVVSRLAPRGFVVTEQARQSPELQAYLDRGLYAPFTEKIRTGLTVLDCHREPVYSFRYPYRTFERFEQVPPLVTQALMFIENRDLLDPDRPQMNPAVDWVRFTRAVLGQLASRIDADMDSPGGSTLATQIEKYRHSPDGFTQDAREKLRQMASASVRAYRQGADTLPVRRQILLDYLNSVPLSAAPRHGEVHGLGDGLWGVVRDRLRARADAADARPGARGQPGRAGPGAAAGGGTHGGAPAAVLVPGRGPRGARPDHRRLPAAAGRRRHHRRPAGATPPCGSGWCSAT